MPELCISTSRECIFARMHGIWSQSAKGEALDRLAQSPSEEEFLRSVHCTGTGNVHEQLRRRRHGTLDGVARLLDEASARFYHAMQADTYYDNLKLLLHGRFGQERQDIARLIVNVPLLPEFDAVHILAEPGNFLARLPVMKSLAPQALAEIAGALEQDGDIMAAECRLDQCYFSSVLACAAAMPIGIRKAARQLTRLRIDIGNLCMLLRNIRLYQLPWRRLCPLLLEGGSLAPAALQELAVCKNIRDAVMLLPAPYRPLLLPLAETGLYASERALWRHLYAEALKLFRNFDSPSLAIAAFPFLMLVENRNLERLYEGIHLGIPASDRLAMLIGA